MAHSIVKLCNVHRPHHWLCYIFQLATNEASGIGRKIWDYITDFWNFLDIFTILLFIAGVVLQVSNCDDCFEASRVVLAINLMTFFFRILHIFSVHKELGPKLVMIGRMVSTCTDDVT